VCIYNQVIHIRYSRVKGDSIYYKVNRDSYKQHTVQSYPMEVHVSINIVKYTPC